MDRPAADHDPAGHRGDGPDDGTAAAARPRPVHGPRPGVRPGSDRHPHPAGAARLGLTALSSPGGSPVPARGRMTGRSARRKLAA
ncbi:Adenylate cyclase [Actinacidiphila bryophytorum]|uniref:Adenylate cyclase n=1 Tax=Actinacidiphila bryophytorum TaxID=1436133 RepID=A0A9W4MK51_9ACTN|nr:Adenylate cyclase [Actinacidiphila bryophytorum]